MGGEIHVSGEMTKWRWLRQWVGRLIQENEVPELYLETAENIARMAEPDLMGAV